MFEYSGIFNLFILWVCGTNPIYRRYMEISFNYLVYFGGHIWINGNCNGQIYTNNPSSAYKYMYIAQN